MARRRMPPSLVIEHLDVVEQLRLRVSVAGESLADFVLDDREQRLHDRVVLAIATTAHTARDPADREHVLILLTRARRSLVRVMDQSEARCHASAPSRGP